MRKNIITNGLLDRLSSVGCDTTAEITISDAVDWLRTEKGLHIMITHITGKWAYSIAKVDWPHTKHYAIEYSNYDDCVLTAIETCCELIENHWFGIFRDELK